MYHKLVHSPGTSVWLRGSPQHNYRRSKRRIREAETDQRCLRGSSQKNGSKMVQLTQALLNYVKRPANKFWKHKRIFLNCAHFYGRRRNVYSVAIRAAWKAWEHAQRNRKTMKTAVSNVWCDRIGASCQELGLPGYFPFMHGLAHSNIALDKKVLADIAWSEPRTFKSLVDIARLELSKDPAQYLETPENVIDVESSPGKSSD